MSRVTNPSTSQGFVQTGPVAEAGAALESIAVMGCTIGGRMRGRHALAAPGLDRRLRTADLSPMATVIDTLSARERRHPEKQNRPDTPILRKPDWLRVRAPGSPGYAATRAIVREHGLVTCLLYTSDAAD